MKKAVYLDHAATTPMRPEVIQEMVRVMESVYGNPSSTHQFGRRAHFELEMAREQVARSIHALPEEIIFNSGGTEGDNTVIIQAALARQALGKHLITTEVEHSAVSEAMTYLEMRGFEVTYLPVDETGSVTAASVKEVLRDDTILVSVMYGNNETGAIFPIREIGEVLHSHQALFHTDAVQAFGTESINVKDVNVDYLSISGHKINGPKGIGFHYVKQGAVIPVLFHGGDQEEKKRAGTENLSSIVGLAKATELLTDEVKERNKAHYRMFKEMILETLEQNEVAFDVNGHLPSDLAHILNVWLKGVPNNLLLSRLDLAGFAISTGSACSAGDVKPSKIIKKLRPEEPIAASESIRISFGLGVTEEDIRSFSDTLVEIVGQLKS